MADDVNRNLRTAAAVLVDTGLAFLGQPPFATIINSFGEAMSSIRTQVLIENLGAFFNEMNKTTEEQRAKFKYQMAQDYEAFTRNIVLAIERMNDKVKSDMIGVLFANLLRERISTDDYLRLVHIVEIIYVKDLLLFRDVYTDVDLHSGFIPAQNENPPQSLIVNNLVYKPEDVGGLPAPPWYVATRLGKVFLDHV